MGNKLGSDIITREGYNNQTRKRRKDNSIKGRTKRIKLREEAGQIKRDRGILDQGCEGCSVGP